MDISSFTGQSKHTRRLTRVMETKSHAGGSTHKRWQPKSHRNHSSPSQLLPLVFKPESDLMLRQRSLAKAKMGHYDEAIALFTQLIERNPLNATDYSNRGLTYFQSGRRDEAFADYSRAIELNPRLDGAYNNRANYHAAQGQFLEAILDYDMALDLNPANIRAWINQGITFRDLEMYERAIESFDLALHLGCLKGHIYAERGRTHHLYGDWNCAIADYQRAIVNMPETLASNRLYLQVELWMDELLAPLHG
ncbi:MAG: tetratricopeptide repeat protein [Timaviella obliquedivisa GSE-PSE-MK23-08B]|nr:tetratricopeptide repeat protein [Timaviella obliquedivisa GSE-PSE-MK23-08B]